MLAMLYKLSFVGLCLIKLVGIVLIMEKIERNLIEKQRASQKNNCNNMLDTLPHGSIE